MNKATKQRKTKEHRKGRRFPMKPQEQGKHPPEWEKDLNPHRLEGQNIGRYSVDEDPSGRTAAEIKEIVRKLEDFSLEELREVPIVPAGTPLKQGAVYLDLGTPAFGPFVATGGTEAGRYNYYVPKAEIPYEYWNRIVRTLCPRRIWEEEAGVAETSSGSKPGQPPEPEIDKTIADSFPASDPASWTMGREKESEEDEITNKKIKGKE